MRAELLSPQKITNEQTGELRDILIAPTLVITEKQEGEVKFPLPIDPKMFNEDTYKRFNNFTYSLGKMVRLAELNLDTLAGVIGVYFHVQGTGYKNEVLSYTWNGKNIIQFLKMTIGEATDFFQGNDKELLKRIRQMGLGYITLGQPLSTFSGGERQRLKLAMELDEQGQLFVFDEPTTGLHPSDIEKLMSTFHRLADRGNTVIVVEHNLDVIAQADWVIDMGPGGGSDGGHVVFEGRVSDLIKHADSKTGHHLMRYMIARKPGKTMSPFA